MKKKVCKQETKKEGAEAVKHPRQPIVMDECGRKRFKENVIVSKLLQVADNNGYSLNEICREGFQKEDLQQFYQLIGYSVEGYKGLHVCSPDEAAMLEMEESNDREKILQAEATHYKEELKRIRRLFRNPVAELYKTRYTERRRHHREGSANRIQETGQ